MPRSIRRSAASSALSACTGAAATRSATASPARIRRVYCVQMSAGRVLGNYVLGELLGRGGMSEVWQASHPTLGSVAIKLMRDSADAERFLREAEVTREIVHPNVVRVLDSGRAPDGTLYIA